jgi:hypothetical protein
MQVVSARPAAVVRVSKGLRAIATGRPWSPTEKITLWWGASLADVDVLIALLGVLVGVSASP